MERAVDGVPHGTVVTNLLDLQARLRGDPASFRPARAGAQLSEDHRPNESGGVGVESMRRRLAALELEIDAYEELVYAWPPVPTSRSAEDARVIELDARRRPPSPSR